MEAEVVEAEVEVAEAEEEAEEEEEAEDELEAEAEEEAEAEALEGAVSSGTGGVGMRHCARPGLSDTLCPHSTLTTCSMPNHPTPI